jgi:hypothetical protein
MAQERVRTVIIPAEGGVIIPPRSAPRLTARPAGNGATRPAAPSRGPVILPETGTGLAAPVLGFVLPALAGALLGGSLAGSKGGGTSGPARTQ